jgi:ATP-dependent Lhr-like helicase
MTRNRDPAGSLESFSPATRAWFSGVFEEPTRAQAQAWAAIGKGDDTLVIAPTGSGKTLAAFLWALDRLAAAPLPADPKRRCRILYISPMRALATDVERNLRAPLTGIRHAARSLGLEEPDIHVAVRTGDTAADERRKLASKPPDVLITTPESLFLLLTSKARETLRSVETVIVDEVHALAGNKRGAHLAVSLERLDALRMAGPEPDAARGPAQRIGLSATVRPVAEVAGFLGGARQVTVVQPPSEKRLELNVVVPVEDMTEIAGPPRTSRRDGGTGDGSQGPQGSQGAQGLPGAGGDPERQRSIWPHVEERVLDLIEQHRSTIVFANSRRLAERLCARLNELAAERAELAAADGDGLAEPAWRSGDGALTVPAGRRPPAQVMAQAGSTAGAPPEVARAHHGSVSRQERADIEEALKRGTLPAVVATSSLELGIDMGAVDLVVQVEAPPSVASGLQRIGRAGHNVGDVSRGVIFPKYQGDLIQATVVAERMRGGNIEELRGPRNPLDVLAQQIVAMTSMDDWPVDELERVIRRAAPFAGLTRPVLDAVLDMLAGRYPSEEFAGLRPRVVWDRLTGVVHGRPGGQRLAVTSGGTIPDRGLFGVFLAGSDAPGPGGSRRHSRRVGELDEEMVYESRVGDVFVLGASSWRIEDITADSVLVTPAPGQPGKLPFWHGDAPGRPAELGAAIGQTCRQLSEASPEDAAAMLTAAGLDELAAGNLLRYLADQREATGAVPDDRTLVIERFRDELGDWRVVLHSPYGARVHGPWALAIAARLRERYGGMDVQAVHTDDGIIVRVPDADEPPPTGVALIEPDEISDIVTAEIGASALFASRFRECAARAMLLPRRQPGRRSPLWQQRQRSAQLLEVARQYPSFPIVLETVRECLQDVFDVPALVNLLRDLGSRKIRIVEVETPTPSPFSRSLLFRYVGAFMYEGDAPLAERRAQALTLDSTLLADLLGQADLRELLDPAVVADTEHELQRVAPDRRCRDLEAVADMLRTIGPLTAEEVSVRCTVPEAAGGWLTELARTRRALEIRVGGQPRWAAIEDAGRLRDALGVPLPPGIPEAFTEPLPDPLGDLVARYARTHGPFGADAVASRYALGIAVVAGTLQRLAAAGRVVEGEFLPHGRGTEWCDAEVLRLLRRRCLARLRKEVEPAPPVALARLLPAWQGVRPIEAATGRGGPGGYPARPRGAAGMTGPGAVLDALDQLAGAFVPASALETLVLPGRVPGYSPAMLDELTAAGEVVWTGAGGLPGGDGWLVLAPAEAAPLLFPEPSEITMTPVHEAILTALSDGGAVFFRMLHERVSAGLAGAEGAAKAPSDTDVAAAIWDLLWAGFLTNDTLGPLRTVLGGGQPRRAGSAPAASRGRGLRHGSRRPSYGRPVMPSRTGPPNVSGRWSLLPSHTRDATMYAHALAQALLDRYGILTKGAVAAERISGGFAAVYPVLRAMEEAGRARRGYFVEGLGAAQFAVPGAVDRMRALAQPRSDRDDAVSGVTRGRPVPYGGTAYGGAAYAGGASGGDGVSAAMWEYERDGANGTDGAGEAGTASVAGEPGWANGAAASGAGSGAGGRGASGPGGRGPGASGPGGRGHGGTAQRAQVIVLAAADPANAYGASLPWPTRPDETAAGHRPGRKAGALVILADGELVLYVERGGRTLLSWTDDPQQLGPAAAALAAAVRAGALGRLTVERADGGGVYDSPLAKALEEAGFRPTPKGLRLRG